MGPMGPRPISANMGAMGPGPWAQKVIIHFQFLKNIIGGMAPMGPMGHCAQKVAIHFPLKILYYRPFGPHGTQAHIGQHGPHRPRALGPKSDNSFSNSKKIISAVWAPWGLGPKKL